jgi:hypothetical protein
VAGRDRTCGAPRFRRALYLAELRPQGWARLDSNQRPLVCKTSALPFELLARELRDKESNLALHVQSVASYRLDDPGPISRLRPPSNGTSTQRRDPRVPALTRSSEAERCFPSHSPALRPWIASRRMRVRRPPSYVEELWSPILDLGMVNSHAKAHAPLPAPFSGAERRGTFSLRRGLDSSRSCSS